MTSATHHRIHLDLRRTASAVCWRMCTVVAHSTHILQETPSHDQKTRSPVQLIGVLNRLAEQRVLWEPLIKFDPISRHYARLAAESGFEAWLLTWVPGQGTEWHDHGGSAGAFLTVRGTLSEQQAMIRSDGPPRILPGIRELPPGALRSFGTKHIHKVTNNALEPAVSLHIYAPALVEMNAYQVVDGDLLRLADSQLAGRNW